MPRLDAWHRPERIHGTNRVGRQQVEVAAVTRAADTVRFADAPLVISQDGEDGRQHAEQSPRSHRIPPRRYYGRCHLVCQARSRAPEEEASPRSDRWSSRLAMGWSNRGRRRRAQPVLTAGDKYVVAAPK